MRKVPENERISTLEDLKDAQKEIETYFAINNWKTVSKN